MSQWSTPPSGPLADLESVQKRLKRRKSHELVAHSDEWTTSSSGHRTFYLATALPTQNMLQYGKPYQTQRKDVLR